MADALALLFESTREEHDTILMRARMKEYARQGGAPVEKILEELGLARDTAASAQSH